MSADRLREAAAVLRERAEAATPGPWQPFDQHGRDFTDEGWSIVGVHNGDPNAVVALTYPVGCERDEHESDAAYIATMHPGVGLALADWLDDAADAFGDNTGYPALEHQRAFACYRVADAILGGAR